MYPRTESYNTQTQPATAYLDELSDQARRVVKLVDTIPLPQPLRAELQQSWRITQQKLAYFRRELSRADGKLSEELQQLHSTLLPPVISYQVKVGAMMISDTCGDETSLRDWNDIWKNFV